MEEIMLARQVGASGLWLHSLITLPSMVTSCLLITSIFYPGL